MHLIRRLLGVTRLDDERGQAIPIFAAALLGLVLMLGVIVDGGNGFQNKQLVQNAADESAIAAALEVAQGRCTTAAKTACAIYSGKYAGMNGANGVNGDSAAEDPLAACAPTSPLDSLPSNTPCYNYPYVDSAGNSHDDRVEVWMKRTNANFFGKLLGFPTSSESARAVASLSSGNPPKITFAALDNTCGKHTLLIRLGGNLVVNQKIYVNSCSGLAPGDTTHDGFDIFNGGSLTAPGIEVVGGWESHNSSRVFVPSGTQCSVPYNNQVEPGKFAGAGTQQVNTDTPGYTPTPVGCPDVSQPELADPFAQFPPAPALGDSQCSASSTSTVAYTPNVTVKTATSQTSTATAFAPNAVTLNGTAGDGTTRGTIGYSPNVTVTANKPIPASASTAPYAKPVTLNGPVGTNTIGNGVVYSPNVTVNTAVTTTNQTTFKVANTGNASQVAKNNVIQIDNELMKVTNVAGAASPWTLTVTRGVNGTTAATHTVGKTVYKNVADTQVQVTNTGNASQVAKNDVISVDGEQMLVTAVSAGNAAPWTLTVVRGFDGTSEAGHSVGAAVLKASPDTVIQVTPSGVKAGDVILIQNEQMLVTSVFGTNPETLVVVRGANSTTEATHAAGLTVFQPVGDTVIQLKHTGAQEVKAGMVIQINSEQMRVASVLSVGNNLYNLTVERGFNFTTEVTHATNATVRQFPDQMIQTTNTGATSPVQAGHLIQINSEQMLVIAVSKDAAAGVWNLTVQRGTFGTTEAAHAANVTVFRVVLLGGATSPSPCKLSTGTQTLFPGTYYGGICIGAAAGSDCVNANCKATAGSTTSQQPYSPAVTVAVTETNDDTNPNYVKLVVSSASPISVGDLISVDDEEMTVSAINGNTLTVQREANGTEDGIHTAGTQVFHVVTAPNGAEYANKETLNAAINTTAAGTLTFVAKATTAVAGGGVIQTGDVIQIGSEAMTVTSHSQNGGGGTSLLENVTVTRPSNFTVASTHPQGAHILLAIAAGTPPPPSVTLTKGVYIMAGGGFSVCGSGSVRAQQGALIYNTNDPSSLSGYGLLGQVNINTSGSVHLAPMTDGIYAGLTIFQDRSLTLNANQCDGKSGNPNQWDIAFQSAAPLPVSGALGSVSGTIYAPHLHADFGDSMSGTANLAVITSCIYINGANSTFNFNPGNGGLFGVSVSLDG